ncbi:MAG: DUF885 domain-containing protein [Bacteroidetes bacterium]|nr:MAG: DUF885 domain-containing protein [Bacteroidota bacterium]
MKLLLYCFILLAAVSCKLMPKDQPVRDSRRLASLLDNYFDDRMKFFPLEATQNGDHRYDDQLPVDFTDSYRAKLLAFFTSYLDRINAMNRELLNDNDRISYDVFKREMEMSIEGLGLGFVSSNISMPILYYTPFNQFTGLPLVLGQLGGGTGFQPFKTVQDYDNWLKRATAFNSWADSAIVYFKKGIVVHSVLPRALVVKMIPQMKSMLTDDPTKSLFYGPIKAMPDSFDNSQKKRLTEAYTKLIQEQILPAYKKLAAFLSDEYLPQSRTSTGIHDIPDGDKQYNYLVRFWTTTNKTPDEIYNIGLAEVERIRGEMEKVKNSTGFNGDLKAFFEYMKNDKKFMPYTEPKQVLDAFAAIQKRIEPNLKKMFGRVPKTGFEIRQTEAFRAASASAEYNQGSPDGSRPGIFYIPILDATKFNVTSGMESLFLHEAIPGHHYQVSLQQEDTLLPRFRRFAWYGAFGEGWALYSESLGRELGLYTDPYQYMGALGDEIHRAIRLVVDVGMHQKGMTREQAIQYMMDNEAISEQGATAEIERYMAIPAQALSYKVGAMKIRELRTRYEKLLGPKFSLAAFHDELLRSGCLPLDVAERKMDEWAQRQK